MINPWDQKKKGFFYPFSRETTFQFMSDVFYSTQSVFPFPPLKILGIIMKTENHQIARFFRQVIMQCQISTYNYDFSSTSNTKMSVNSITSYNYKQPSQWVVIRTMGTTHCRASAGFCQNTVHT